MDERSTSCIGRLTTGELVNNGKGPYLTTDEDYGDIELLLEYKTVAKADSGHLPARDTASSDLGLHQGRAASGIVALTEVPAACFNNAPGDPGRLPLVLADQTF